jgi:lysozyme family protein
MRGNWEKSLDWCLEDEGGNDDDPNDSGGRTSRGITQREYNAWCQMHNTPAGDVWHATAATIEAIYQAQYWQPHCDYIPSGTDYLFFDMAVNMGPSRATMILQRALDVGIDGHFGVITMNAVQQVKNAAALVNSIEEDKTEFYEGLARNIPHDRGFLNGWLNRVRNTKRRALTLIEPTLVAAAAPAVKPAPPVVPAPASAKTMTLTLQIDETGAVKGSAK